MAKIYFCHVKVTFLQLKQRYATLTFVITLEMEKNKKEQKKRKKERSQIWDEAPSRDLKHAGLRLT